MNNLMSSSLASAKRRRAGIQSSTQPPQPPQPQQPPQPPQPTSVNQRARMSLPQLINSMEARIKVLEENKPIEDNKPQTENQEISFNVTNPDTGETKNMTMSDYMTDMDKKFFMLAEELTNMKDIVMKLQTFTMEVNKNLYEERIKILSEIPENVSISDGAIDEENNENINTTL
jgi:hypothetical protein